LSKAYKNVQALKSLDLKVAEHSIFGFLGPNGAGKTTAIKLLPSSYCWGLPDRPAALDPSLEMIFGAKVLLSAGVWGTWPRIPAIMKA